MYVGAPESADIWWRLGGTERVLDHSKIISAPGG